MFTSHTSDQGPLMLKDLPRSLSSPAFQPTCSLPRQDVWLGAELAARPMQLPNVCVPPHGQRLSSGVQRHKGPCSMKHGQVVHGRSFSQTSNLPNVKSESPAAPLVARSESAWVASRSGKTMTMTVRTVQTLCQVTSAAACATVCRILLEPCS